MMRSLFKILRKLSLFVEVLTRYMKIIKTQITGINMIQMHVKQTLTSVLMTSKLSVDIIFLLLLLWRKKMISAFLLIPSFLRLFTLTLKIAILTAQLIRLPKWTRRAPHLSGLKVSESLVEFSSQTASRSLWIRLLYLKTSLRSQQIGANRRCKIWLKP